MKKIETLRLLPVKDQVIICVTDALAAKNRYMEACPHFSVLRRLDCIIFRSKNNPQIDMFCLHVEYDSDGMPVKLGGSISINVNHGLINYQHIFTELQKFIPLCSQVQFGAVNTQFATRYLQNTYV